MAQALPLWLGSAVPLTEEAPESAWQFVISSQIEAFRAADGATALSLAGAAFQSNFDDPNKFMMAIISSGYGALVLSRSHSFGDFSQIDAEHVVQVVRIIGPDQHLYRAIYELQQEAEGWRVEGVAMAPEPGIGI